MTLTLIDVLIIGAYAINVAVLWLAAHWTSEAERHISRLDSDIHALLSRQERMCTKSTEVTTDAVHALADELDYDLVRRPEAAIYWRVEKQTPKAPPSA
jgi:hypothetical protein